jgi:anaerobic selenocysteine-containing dehydrogenase
MEPKDDVGPGRREFLYFLGGLGAANAIGLGTWLTLEALVPKGNADEYHKSVCRYCGTGCGIRVGAFASACGTVRSATFAAMSWPTIAALSA